MSPQAIRAIDVHAHIGRFAGAATDLLNDLHSGDADMVLDRARAAGVEATFVSPLEALMPRGGGDPLGGNAELAGKISAYPGLYQWVVVDPLTPRTFAQAAEILSSPRCVGIKIHPEEHRYPITEHGEDIFAFAAEHGAVIQSHSGEANSLPIDFVPFANEYPATVLIVSHFGYSTDDDLSRQVRAVEAARHRNIYTDTSSSKSINRGLIEWAVGEIGSDRIFFGTDSPLYDAPMHRGRIDHADISDEDRNRILRGNALRVFGAWLAGGRKSG